jgi:tetratricopeptide (TPR) repeat protein
MSDVFISHVEEDSAVALQLGEGLERSGFSVWCYENDSLPGISHLLQTSRAIDDCKAFILIASPRSTASHQVGKEVERAHERGKSFIPVLINMSFEELVAKQRLWGVVIGTQVTISLPPGGVPAILPRIVKGLKQLGVQPRSEASAAILGAGRLKDRTGIIGTGFQQTDRTLDTKDNRVFVLGFKPSTKGIFGREEFARDCAEQIKSGETEFLCLHGPAGIGKSTVAALMYNDLSETAIDRFARFIWCHLTEDSELETVLLRLVMIATDGNVPALEPDKEAFEMLLDLLRMRLVSSPAFVVFDNLDNAFSLSEVAGTFSDERWPELFRAFFGGKSAVLVTSRQTPRFFEPSAHFRVVDGISQPEAIKLMRDAGVKDDDSVLKETYQLMQGHPMALSALAATVVRKPRYRRMISRAGDIMEALREGPDRSRNPIILFEKVIHADRLPANEYSLITVMPVLFRPEAATTIGALRPEIPIDVVEEALDELSLRSLARMDDGDPPLYSLHPLVREVAMTLVENPGTFHERAYDHYLSLPWDKKTKDPRQVEHLRLAALHALAMDDLGRAKAVLYENIRLAELLEQWGRYDLALPLHRQELDVAREGGFDDDIMRAAGLVSECLIMVGSCDEALVRSEEALRIALAIGNTPGEGFYKGQIGRIHYRTGKFVESFKWLEEALEIAKSHGDRKCEGIFRGLMGMNLSKDGKFDSALKWLKDAYEIAVEVGDGASETEWKYAIGHAHYLQGDYEQAKEAFLPALGLAIERGDKIRESTLRGLSGEVYTATGEFDRALEQFELALEVDARIGHRRHEGAMLSAVAKIEMYRGNDEKALGLMDRALKIAVEIGSKGGEAFRRGRIGEILLEMGKYDEAMASLQLALSFAVQSGNRSNESPWRGGVGEVYLRQGDFKTALEWLVKAFAIAVEIDDRENQNEWAGKIGQAYLEQGQYPEAEEWLHKALELALQIGDIVNEKNHRLNIGRLLVAQGKPCDAVGHLEKALEIALKLGMVDKLVDQFRIELEAARSACVTT